VTLEAYMTVDAACPSVFDAALPTVEYDVTESFPEVYPRLRAAQQKGPVALGPFGPEILSHDLVRIVLRDHRFQIPPGLNLAMQGITEGPLCYVRVDLASGKCSRPDV